MSAPARWSLAWTRSDRLGLMILLTLALVALICAAAGARPLGPRVPVDETRVQLVQEKIDPNTASAASLRRLPMIGLARAQKIIAYRESAAGTGGRTFARPEDLEKISGIGPGIVGRMAGELVLPSASPPVRASQPVHAPAAGE